jgi:leucyl aminopeptidase (aminopeptidase T)
MDIAGDRSPYHGPVHANIGTNPQAKLSQHLEFERLRGTITFGFGDNALLTQLTKTATSGVSSAVHWDVMALLPTITLDDRAIVTAGIISNDL